MGKYHFIVVKFYNFIIEHFNIAVLKPIRVFMLIKLHVVKDKTTTVRRQVYFDDPTKVHIGRDCLINTRCGFYTGVFNESKIEIGDKTKIGMGTSLITVTHEIGDKKCRAGTSKASSITIGSGCWIGANSTILPDVVVGDGCVIAAGSVVTKSCDDNSLYAGVPAKLIKRL